MGKKRNRIRNSNEKNKLIENEREVTSTNSVTEYEEVSKLLEWIVKYAQKNPVFFSAVCTAILTIGTGAIKCLFFSHYYAVFSIYNIDVEYIDLSKDNIMAYFAFYFAIFCVITISNIIFYCIYVIEIRGKVNWKKYKAMVIFFVIELFIMLVISIIWSKAKVFELITIGISSVIHLFVLVLTGVLLFLLVNLFAIVFLVVSRLAKVKRNRNAVREEGGKQDNHVPNTRNKYDKMVELIVTFALTLIFEIFYVYFSSYYFEYNRTGFKLVMDETRIASESKKEYEFSIYDRTVKLYPVIYENDDVYILSRLYVNGAGVEVDYNYQKIIEKVNVETYYCKDIHKIVGASSHQEQVPSCQNGN